ncbi:hypothetical protein BIW11_08162 [Tropilaelaps mercedesae]|uniref:Uncharacterized protein n=1 Tax=Tropilaelaps mercedesae TaxID=418985 RepID=A0A1V9XR26_9ACAR|nr:hypothetical protein BIW11_08162 [Tropilaelaps mercedesae]
MSRHCDTITLLVVSAATLIVAFPSDSGTPLNVQGERWCMLRSEDVISLRAQPNRSFPIVCDSLKPNMEGSKGFPETISFGEFIKRQLTCLNKRTARSLHGACTLLRNLPISLQIRYVFVIPFCLLMLSASMCITCLRVSTARKANYRLSGAIGRF